MKIGVTGSDHICDRIQKTLEKRMPDLEVVYRRSNDYRYGLEAAAQFQKGKVSLALFYWADQLSLCFKAAGAKRSLDLSSAQSGFHLKSAGGICCPLFLRAGCHQYRYV